MFSLMKQVLYRRELHIKLRHRHRKWVFRAMRTERSRNVGASSSLSLQNTLLNPTSTRMPKAPIFQALNHSSASVFKEKDGRWHTWDLNSARGINVK